MKAMQKCFLAGIALLLSCAAQAAESYPTLDAFLKVYRPGPPDEYVESIEMPGAKAGITRIFGVVNPRQSEKGGGRIFVLAPLEDGTWKVEGLSPAFETYMDANFGQGYIEILEVAGDDRFSVQFNQSQGPQGTDTFTYRFSLRDGNWRVSGCDYTSSANGGDESQEMKKISVNFLTGARSWVSYDVNDKVNDQGRSKADKPYPKLLLSDFTPYEDRYK